jgi:phospholipid transport system substrate-binding protein
MCTKKVLAFVLLCIAYVMPNLAVADEKSAASDFVNNIGKQALAIISNTEKSKEEKAAALEQLFTKNVDIDWIAKFVVGRYWKIATDDQKKQYMDNYRAFILSHYTTNFAEFSNADFEVTKIIADDNGGNIVTMRIKRPQAEDIVVDYTIKKSDKGALRVYDITVEGVSMITTQRSDFSSYIAQNGFDYLISQLAARTKKDL